jgi:hypothetical protein
MTLQEHIKNNEKELADPLVSSQRRRHLSSELIDLLKYQSENPTVSKDPTALELFCYFNPSELECKIFNL